MFLKGTDAAIFEKSVPARLKHSQSTDKGVGEIGAGGYSPLKQKKNYLMSGSDRAVLS